MSSIYHLICTTFTTIEEESSVATVEHSYLFGFYTENTTGPEIWMNSPESKHNMARIRTQDMGVGEVDSFRSQIYLSPSRNVSTQMTSCIGLGCFSVVYRKQRL